MANEAPIRFWTTEPPERAVRKALDRMRRVPDVVRVAVTPDVHIAGAVCNGVALATRKLIYPAAVGGDIGCGYAIVALKNQIDIGDQDLHYELLRELRAVVPVIRHRRRDGLPVLDDGLSPSVLSAPALTALAKRDGPLELGTLGRGNHFLELQHDTDGRLWLMVHCGSRVLGQHIARHHLSNATMAGRGLACLDADSDSGQAYLNDVRWARRFAARNRLRILRESATVMKEKARVTADWSTLVDTDHNHVQCEQQDGESLMVHRKGANQAAAGMFNIIPGSMAGHTYHVSGRGCTSALMSSSHGAGRRMSRTEARRQVKANVLHRQLAGVTVDPDIANRLIDEAPAAYKDLDQVMRAQKDLVRIVRRLNPVLCFKGV